MANHARSSSYFAGLAERAPTYMYPLLLIAIEWVLRAVSVLGKAESFIFVGPTLVATGIGLGLPLTCYRARGDASPSELHKMRKRDLDVIHRKTKVYRGLAWVTIIALTVLWIGSIVAQNEELRSQLSLPGRFMRVPMYFFLGAVGYWIGFIMSELKEIANG